MFLETDAGSLLETDAGSGTCTRSRGSRNRSWRGSCGNQNGSEKISATSLHPRLQHVCIRVSNKFDTPGVTRTIGTTINAGRFRRPAFGSPGKIGSRGTTMSFGTPGGPVPAGGGAQLGGAATVPAAQTEHDVSVTNATFSSAQPQNVFPPQSSPPPHGSSVRTSLGTFGSAEQQQRGRPHRTELFAAIEEPQV